MTNSFLWLFCFLMLFSFFSCNSENSKEIDFKSEKLELELTEKVCTDFAIKIHTSIVNGDSTFINSYFDWSEFSADINLNEHIIKRIKSENWLQIGLMNEVRNGGHLKFITYFEENDKHYIILRQFVEPQTVNYLEIELGVAQQSIVIKDLYDYNRSSKYSTWIKDYAHYYNNQGADWENVMETNENIYDSVLKELNTGNIKEAYLLLNSFDKNYQKTEMYNQLKEQVILNAIDPQVVITYLNQKLQGIPIGSKGRWLTMFYYNAFKENFADALIAITNLEVEVGQDGVIDFLKGNMYFELSNYEKAVESFNKAISFNPNISTFHLAKVYALVEVKNYEAAVESLLVLDDYFDVTTINWKEEFASLPEFLSSAEYINWQNRIEN